MPQRSNGAGRVAPATDELLSINDAARRASVSRRTIYLWIDKGKLRYTRTVGGAIRVYASSLFVDDVTRSVNG